MYSEYQIQANKLIVIQNIAYQICKHGKKSDFFLFCSLNAKFVSKFINQVSKQVLIIERKHRSINPNIAWWDSEVKVKPE